MCVCVCVRHDHVSRTDTHTHTIQLCCALLHDSFHWNYSMSEIHQIEGLTPPPKSTKSRQSDFSVSRGTNSNWEFEFEFVPRNFNLSLNLYRGILQISIWICSEEMDFLHSVDLGVSAFSVEFVKRVYNSKCSCTIEYGH